MSIEFYKYTMFEDDFMPCWKLDLLPERIARRYMRTHIRLKLRTTKPKTANVNFQINKNNIHLILQPN